MSLVFDFSPDLEHEAGIFIPDTPGNDDTADDGPAIQAALDAALAKADGGSSSAVVWLRPGTRYYLPNGGLVTDNTLVGIHGNGAKLDWTQRTFTDPDSLPDLVVNGDFTGTSIAAPWALGVDHNNGALVVGGGAASNNAADGQFSQFGQQVPTVEGQTYRFTVHQSITPANNQQYVSYGFRPGGIGVGSTTAEVTRSTDPEAALGVWEFTLSAPSDDTWLTIQSNNDFNITSVVMREEPDNTCLLFKGTAQSPQFGHTSNGVQQLGMYGPGKGSFADGIVYDTDVENRSQRGFLNNMEIQHFQRGIVFGARSYLVMAAGSVLRGCNVGIATLANSPDAGENFGWYHGVFGSNDIAILNDGGFRFHFFGPSFDYGRQIYVGDGVAEFNSCWFEHAMWTATDAADPDFSETQYRFDLKGGALYFKDGLMQYTRASPVDNIFHEHLFRLANRAHVTIDGTMMRSIGGSTDEYATGDGLISVNGARLSSPQNSPVVTLADERHNLAGAHGGFEEPEIGIDTWVQAGQTAIHPIGRHFAYIGGQPTRTGDMTAGSTSITNTDTTQVSVGDILVADGFPEGTTVTAIVSATEMTAASPWLAASETGASFKVVLAAAIAGIGRIELSTAEARTGTQSLRFAKERVGTGTSFVGSFAFPILKERRIGIRYYYKVPTGLGTGAFTMFLTGWFVRAQGMDDPATRPTILQRQSFLSQNITVDLDAGIDWTEQRISSINADLLAPTDGFASHWATHAMVDLSLVNAPSGFELFIDDVHANYL